MTKEQRTFLKQIEKQIQIFMKLGVKKTDCKLTSNSLYEKVNNYFIHAVWFVCFIDNQYQLVLRQCIKPYNYDILFWQIIGMEDNLKQKDTLRANGAYVAPSIQWSEKIYEIKVDSEIEDICDKAINDFSLGSKEFISKITSEFDNLDSYILGLSGIIDENLLKILANINLNNYLDAMRIAQTELEQGRTGRFENKGIGINEYVIEYCKNKIL